MSIDECSRCAKLRERIEILKEQVENEQLTATHYRRMFLELWRKQNIEEGE